MFLAKTEGCLRRPCTGVHPYKNVIEPRRILLILKPDGVLANHSRRTSCDSRAAARRLTQQGQARRTQTRGLTHSLGSATTLNDRAKSALRFFRWTGSFTKPGPLEEISEEGWHASVNGNLTATFLTIKSILPGMKERKVGSIITISSAAGRIRRHLSPIPLLRRASRFSRKTWQPKRVLTAFE